MPKTRLARSILPQRDVIQTRYSRIIMLELRQYKNDSTESKNRLLLKLRSVRKSATISKLADFLGAVESFLYCLGLDCIDSVR